MPTKTVAFLSNFSYSSNSAKYFDYQDIPLAIYDAIAVDPSVSTTIPIEGAIAKAFENLEFARKRSLASLIFKVATTRNLNFGEGSTSGFYNICGFSAESGSPKVAFNTYINNEVWSYAAELSLQFASYPDAQPVLTNFPQRMIATANNCVHFPQLSKTIGVPLIYASNDNPNAGDRTRLLKYPRFNNSSSTITLANYYPVDLSQGYNKHVSLVSCQEAYYFSVGGTISNNLQIKRLNYYGVNSPVTPYNVLSLNHPSGQIASSSMWVDNFNDLFISQGDRILKVFASLPNKNTWADSAFNLNNVEVYGLQTPYIIERAIVDIETGKHYALCSKNTTGYTVNTTLYMCQITFGSGAIATVTELSPDPVQIIDTDNKHINIPTKGNYIVITSFEPDKAIFDLTTLTWQPLNTVIDFRDPIFDNNSNIRVYSITQPTFRSSSNYLTAFTGSEYFIWQLSPSVSN